jgi:hypothetical protein
MTKIELKLINAWLKQNDPNALSQAIDAITWAETADDLLLKNFKLFGEEKINASIGNIISAAENLTPIEFRYWINACKTYESFHYSHFQGQEEQFLKTGKWDWVDTMKEDKKGAK